MVTIEELRERANRVDDDERSDISCLLLDLVLFLEHECRASPAAVEVPAADCPGCAGHGWYFVEHPLRAGVPMQRRACERCSGTGKAPAPKVRPGPKSDVLSGNIEPNHESPEYCPSCGGRKPAP